MPPDQHITSGAMPLNNDARTTNLWRIPEHRVPVSFTTWGGEEWKRIFHEAAPLEVSIRRVNRESWMRMRKGGIRRLTNCRQKVPANAIRGVMEARSRYVSSAFYALSLRARAASPFAEWCLGTCG